MKESTKTRDHLIEELQELEKQFSLLEAENLSQAHLISEYSMFKASSDRAGKVMPLYISMGK